MQSAYIHLDTDKAISPAILFGVAVRHFAASALTPAKLLYTVYSHHIYYTHNKYRLHKPVSVIVTGLVLLCPHARCLNVVSRAVFVASGFARSLLCLPLVRARAHPITYSVSVDISKIVQTWLTQFACFHAVFGS